MSNSIADRDTFVALARAEAGLEDFGDTWFFANLDALIASINAQALLSEAGAQVAAGGMVRALVNRLRFTEFLKQHPEIRDEEVSVAAIVVGLPRTGSTMLHRMLCAAPGMTGVRWYEAQNYAPFPGETRGDPAPRREAAKYILAYMLGAIPDLMSIHPMSIDQPDEEVIILGQLFSSTMNEAMYHAPDYAHWLLTSDRVQPYRDLTLILKALQWLDPSRAGAKWVLKTPGHLMALDAVREVFPEAKIVMTHREPAATIASYCSMEYSLYQMGSDQITREHVARFWEPRLHQLLTMFMQARVRAGDGAFIDVRYADLLTDAVGQGVDVLERTGIAVTPEIRAGMDEWIEANRREDRAPHKYTLADFGLERAEIEARFADYRQRFILS